MSASCRNERAVRTKKQAADKTLAGCERQAWKDESKSQFHQQPADEGRKESVLVRRFSRPETEFIRFPLGLISAIGNGHLEM